MMELPMADRYAVFGYPIHHSKSPFIHSEFARATGQALTYEAIEAPPATFGETVAAFFAAGGRGANVTLPHKEAALRLADEATDRAKLAGAANTLAVAAHGLLADNTDGVGLVRDLRRRWQVPLAGQRILIFGAGGATRGILGPLLAEGPELLVISNRTAARAEALLAHFQPHAHAVHTTLATLPWGTTARLYPPFHLVLNATSMSLGDEAPPLTTAILAPEAVAYDLMYAATPTPFLALARRLGAAQIIDGLGMLVEQAAESFALWRGVFPATEPVFQKLRAQLAASSAKTSAAAATVAATSALPCAAETNPASKADGAK
jgi:shikimate dehydrogenase